MNSRNIAAVVLAAAAGLTMIYFGASSRPEEPEKVYTTAELPPEWKPEVLDAFERLAISDRDGRVKSFHTFAHYELFRTRAYSTLSLKVEDEKRKRSWTATAWTLDCLFFPELANNYPSFVVEDSEVLAHLGLTSHTKQRDRYTFNELLPARAAIMAESERLSGMDSEKMTRIERLTNSLAINFNAYEGLTKALDFLRAEVSVPADAPEEPLKAAAGKTIPAHEAAALLTATPAWKTFRAQPKDQPRQPLPEWIETVLAQVDQSLRVARDPLWFPPTAEGKDNWASSTGFVKELAENGPHAAAAPAKLRELAELVALAKDKAMNDEFQTKLAAFAVNRTAEAKAVGAYGKTVADRAYLKWRIFEYAKWFFILLFLVAAISWLKPGAQRFHSWVKRCAWIGLAAIAVGIGQRVYITGWGPVTNIYETIPYITLLAGVFAMLMSRAMKNVIPVSIAIAVGAAGMFLASRHETGNSKDTIPALEAVLRSNYWLWTHVTSINLGYATVMLAAIFSMVYIFARLFDIMRVDDKLCRDLTRCAYGILCFGLFFSLIGTILGGIWGNDSWGRFWGWDPKENGALLICFWCLFVMHMRLGGWIKEFGLHLWTAMAAVPVIFSWWHVNQLQVGLHSYGFTDGLDTKLKIAYSVVGGIILLGVVVRILEGVARRQMAAAKQAALPEGRVDPA